MKKKLWLFQIPAIALFTFCFWVVHQGEMGSLSNVFLRETIFPNLRSVTGAFTNAKFRFFRGPQQPKNKVVVVAIDDASIVQIGRWPWHRDIQAALIERIFAAGAKVVGLDIVNSEAQERVPAGLMEELKKRGLENLAEPFDADGRLTLTTAMHEEHLVLGWASEAFCQPAHLSVDECPVVHPEIIASMPEGYEKFAFKHFEAPAGFDPQKAPQVSVITFLSNLGMFNSVAKHAGYFNAFQDSDNYIRRIPLFMFANGKPYPTLALEMARVGLNEELRLKLDDRYLVEKIEFAKSGRTLPVTPMGVMEINFRGPGLTFPYVSALDLFLEKKELEADGNYRKLASTTSDLFKDAYVLVGVTALGAYDMRAFPFDANVAGVEGHANILDNILSGDALVPSTSGTGSIWIFLMMTVGALIFAFMAQRLESVPGLLLFISVMAVMGGFDLQVLFHNNINWNTSFLFMELVTIFVFTIAAKYVLEEKDKKFLKSAFGKYVAPALVDTIVKDPSKLSLGGDKKDLTILFSDVRGFTTLSEKMDAKHLAKFLNDYLDRMTKIVFKHNGTLDKYIGDAIMAFWGAPMELKNHAGSCLKASIEMMQALNQERERWLKEYGVDVQIGIGVNSGLVNVGNMGSKDNFNYTVIGDHVNLASRLEGLTKYYGAAIVTTRQTLDSVIASGEAPPAYRVLDSVKVKGKKQAVELLEIFYESLPAEGLRVFEEARELYLKQQWDAAIQKFFAAEKLLIKNMVKRDGPCAMYIERCEHFKLEPPAKDWDGSWEMLSK